MAFNAPHTPFHEPPAGLHTQNATNNQRRYRAAIQALDTEIGRLIDSLGDAVANTVIVFVGDNGTPGQVTQAPYTTSKGSIYQGGVHVPFIVAGPGVGGPAESGVPVHVADLFSTFLDLGGIDPTTAVPGITVDGLSLTGLLSGDENTLPRNAIYTDIVSDDPVWRWHAVRGTRFKLIEIDGAHELYDLDADPLETSDLLAGGLTDETEAAYIHLLKQLAGLRGEPVCDADTALPLGTLNIDDVLAFLGAFAVGGPLADLASPIGTLNIDDVFVFLGSFASGCE